MKKSNVFLLITILWLLPAGALFAQKDYALDGAQRASDLNFEPPAPPKKDPKLAHLVTRAADAYADKGVRWSDDFRNGELMVEADRILVEIRCDAKYVNQFVADYVSQGMEVRHHNVPGLVEAWVPVGLLRAIEAESAVHFVGPSRPVFPMIGNTDTEELALSMADVWHAAGITGSGVTLGNIDGGYINYVARQATNDWPSGGQLTIQDINGGAFGTATTHGTNTVEINYDMAPGADYVVYETTTLSDWYAALVQAPADGVDVLSISLGAPLDGVGDGSDCPPGFPVPCGSIAEGSGIARNAGILVVNAAGNERESHWGGLYNDSLTVPGTHDFGGGNVSQSSVCLPPGFQLISTLHWDDWTAVNHDYDLLLLRLVAGPAWQVVATSSNPQTGGAGQAPQEFIVFNASGSSPGCPPGTSNYGFAIQRNSAPTNRNLQLFTGLPMFNPVHARSLGFPGDSPHVFTVAAVDVNSTVQESYSSEGPVLGPGGSLAASAIQKPDVSSVANVSTESTAGGPGFNGTSAATPHVAGIAALIRQLNPTLTVAQLEAELHQYAAANDLGAPGFDTQHGHGLLRFTGGPPTVLEGLCFFDAAMTMPVNTVAVEVFNLTTGSSGMAGTLNNYYNELLEPGVDVNVGDTLRLIAKDGTQFINVTDHLVTAGDLSSGFIQIDLVLDEYYLDAVDCPYYEADTPNPDQNAGPAVAQMVLNYIWWNSITDPTPPLTFPDQSVLYSYGISQNLTPGLSHFDPTGMLRTIQDNRPLPYSQFGYNFSIRSDTDGNEMLKQISQWISYTIGTFGGLEPGHPDHVPGSIPAYGDYSNWMLVRGIHTNEPAYPLPATLQVYGFWVNDPFPAGLGGIGENTYKTAAELLATYYLPLATGDSYDGKFVAICEPPSQDPQKQVSLMNSRSRFSNTAKDVLSDWRNAASPPKTLEEAAHRWVVAAAVEAVSEELLPYDDGFRARFETTVPGTPLIVNRADGDYFAVPFNDGLTAVVVLVDAEEGTFKEASWVDDPAHYPPVSKDQCLDLVASYMARNDLNGSLKDAAVELSYEGGSPYFPNWKVALQGMVFTVDQNGNLSYQKP